MERVHRGEVARGQVEVQEWVDFVGGGWEDRELVRALVENAFVLNAEQRLLMKSEHPATL